MGNRDFNQWDRQPRILSDEEISNPMLVIDELFDYAHLPDLRTTLWEWLKTTVSGNFNRKTLHYTDRESLLAFYEKLQKLIEAAYLLLVAHELAQPIPVPSAAYHLADELPETGTMQDTLPPSLVQEIVRIVSPAYVFSMGQVQETNGTLPIYFFLVVMPNNDARTYAECQAMVENACPESGTIKLSAIKAIEMTRHLEQGHPLYARLCTNEYLLYSQAEEGLPFPNQQAVGERLAVAGASLDAVLTTAWAFYEGARFYCSKQHYRLALFLLQQAAEHSLRGFLQAVTGRNYIGHDILLLRFQALPFFPALVHLLPVHKDKCCCLVYLLGKAYVHARYQPNFTVSVAQVAQVNEWIHQLLSAIPYTFSQRNSRVIP